MTKRKRIELLVFPILALILEALPAGVRMVFASGPESRSTVLCAYFSMLPFGYGIFGPTIAALLTVCLLIAALFTWKKGRRPWAPILAAAALLAALSPLLYVPDTFTVLGGFICLLLALELIFSLLPVHGS